MSLGRPAKLLRKTVGIKGFDSHEIILAGRPRLLFVFVSLEHTEKVQKQKERS